MITWMKMWAIFKSQKFSLRVLLSIRLIFCQFQPGVAYKSVAYKKKHVFSEKELFINDGKKTIGKDFLRDRRQILPLLSELMN